MSTTTGTGLREQKKQQARHDILQSAERLIDQVGYEQAKMRDIAAAAGVSYQTLYNYFPTKAQILRALLTDQVDNLSGAAAEILQAYEGGLLDALDGLSQLSFQVVAEGNRELWRIATIDLFHQTEPAQQLYQLIDEVGQETITRLLRDALRAGELMSGVPIRRLSETLFDLTDYQLLRFVLDSEAPLEKYLARLSAQIRLVVSPYLTPERSVR